jgi:RimJ/RimL family protein N-acetyltransferase
MTFEGKTVRLRPLSMDDLDNVMKWVNDPDVTRTLMTGRYPMTRETEREWLEAHVKISTTEVHYALETLAGEYLGGVNLFRIWPVERHAELGIVIGNKAQWGKGYAKEAMQLMLRYGFEQLNLHVIYLHVYADHPRAIRLYEYVGFKHEGRLRDRVYREGKYHDFLAMSILRAEWEQRHKG